MYLLNIMDCLGINGKNIFLNKLAEKEWNFQSGNMLFHKFEKGTSQKYIVVSTEFFDIEPEKAKKSGWEYICSQRNLSYFRAIETEEQYPLLITENLRITDKPYQRLIIGCMIPILLKYSLESLGIDSIQYICFWISMILYTISFFMGGIVDCYDALTLKRTGSFKSFSSTMYSILIVFGFFKQVSRMLLIIIFITHL